ncbi:uncharacterized protein LOC111830630 [Capsella rubella]|uniref:uncharacterized protein LOC111830630 n=1 Tax=Capsella rubella TaxID=81985 RepID=UPI000CD5B01A|nr:uncharacterized protein LOC111830630 [Capsella rubella]
MDEREKEEKADSVSVSNLFKRHCHMVSRNITCSPRLLGAHDAVKAPLVPKLEFLQFKGASSFYNDFVRDLSREEEEEEEEEADDITGDVFVLKALGVPQELLIPLFNSNTLGSVSGKGKYRRAIKEVVDKGFDPTTLKIFQALRIRNKTVERKSQCLL